ncbi:MAG: hypothetical protein ACQKBT_03385 [Puniceicoccales bacterium]
MKSNLHRYCHSYMHSPTPLILVFLLSLFAQFPVHARESAIPTGETQGPIPITFTIDKPGYVTLVIEDENGKRVRNLFSGEKYEAGTHTVYWDGMDIGEPFTQPKVPGYRINRDIAQPGTYTVRGIVRDEIKLIYEFTVYPNTSGTPWRTYEGDEEGGWLGDHGQPTATLYIPAERAPKNTETMLLTNSVNEAGNAAAWTDLDGNKYKGQRHIGGAWTGASHLAYDWGENAHPDIYAYSRMDWTAKEEGKNSIRITGLIPDEQKSGRQRDHSVANPILAHEWISGNPGGFAVYNSLVITSVHNPGRLLFFDASEVDKKTSAKELGTVEMEEPHALTFDRSGNLYVINEDRLERYTVGEFPNPLTHKEVIVDSGLDEPRYLATDAEGNIYVAEWGESHQVKVFTPQGKLIRTIGNPGGPKTGPFDPERMAYPYGLSVDSEGKLWVASRRWWVPKVIWVWDEDGNHVRNHYGPTIYGGGGTFDPSDPTRILYHNSHGGIEFEVDWENGTGEPKGIYMLNMGPRNDHYKAKGIVLPWTFRGARLETPYRARGHDYITNFNSEHTSGSNQVILMKDESPNECLPMMMFGSVGTYEDQIKELGLWETLPFMQIEGLSERSHYSASRKTLFLWLDENGDGIPQKEEFTFHEVEYLTDLNPKKPDYRQGRGILREIELGPDLEILARFQKGRGDHGGLLLFKPTSVDENGMPHYDLTQYEIVITEDDQYRGASSNAMLLEDGRYILTGGPLAGYSPSGERIWTYHSEWPSLHSGHGAPRSPQYSGQIMSTTRVMGVPFTPEEGEAGPLFALNSDLGLAYLFTADGLLVDSLFAYTSEGPEWAFLEHERGMDVTNVNYVVENFHPTITKMDDGRVLMSVGKTGIGIVEVKGLDSIRRFTGEPITLTEEETAAIRQHQIDLAKEEVASDGPPEMIITRMRNPVTIDGNLDEWPEADWTVIQRLRVSSGFRGRVVDYITSAMTYDDENLYVTLRSYAGNPILNEGGPLSELFSTGGGLDIHLATKDPSTGRKEPVEGDVRILISKVKRDIVAARFRPIDLESPNPEVYYSSVGVTTIDRIDDISNEVQVGESQVTLPILDGRKQHTYEQLEVAIPFSVIGWDPKELPETIGDIGILIGNDGRTTQRIYWHNQATGLVSDLPGEARLQPHMWGPIKLQP